MTIVGIPVAEAATVAFESGLAEAISSETGEYTRDNSTVLVSNQPIVYPRWEAATARNDGYWR